MTLTTIFLTLVGIYAIYLFYNMKMKRYLFFLSIIGVVGFVFGINRLEVRNQNITNKTFESLFAQGQFAQGQVLYFGKNTSAKGAASRSSIHFSFVAMDGVKYEGIMSTLIPDFFDKERKKDWKLRFQQASKNDSFLVLYNELNPEESVLLLDMPLIKNGDADKYIKDFEGLRK